MEEILKKCKGSEIMPQNANDIAKRRAQRRRKARLKHLKVGFTIFLIFAVIIGIVLSLTVLFPIKRVSTAGSSIYDGEELSESSGLLKKNIFTASEEKVLNNLREKYPFIDSVKLKRELPDKINLTVTDAKEYYCYKSKEGYYSASEKEYILKLYQKKPKNTIEIRGDFKKLNPGEKAVFRKETAKNSLDQIRNNLDKKKIKTDYIDLTDMNDIKIGVKGDFKVLLGNNSYLDKKIAHLKGMLDNINKGKKGTINLSMWTPSKSEGTFIKAN